MIHRIEAGDMVMYTGDAGYDQFKKAMREWLIQKFKELKSYVKVGEHYSVSDNAVKKWCETYGIINMVKE